MGEETGSEAAVRVGAAEPCPSCGDATLWTAVSQAAAAAALPSRDFLWVSSTTCSDRLHGRLPGFGFHIPAGRALPVAAGAKLANPALTVLAACGASGRGLNLGDLVLAARQNAGLACLIVNSVPDNAGAVPALAAALVSGAAFAARVSPLDPVGLTGVVKRALARRGFAVIEVLTPDWPLEKTLPVEGGAGDLRLALERAADSRLVPLGVLYEGPPRMTWEDQDPAVKRYGPPVRQRLSLTPAQQKILLEGFL